MTPNEARMTGQRSIYFLATVLLAAPSLSAQQAADTADIHPTLRAFYFNLAHRDWEAIASQVLSAKIVAHRPAPAAMVAAEATPRDGAAIVCAPEAPPAGAEIRLDGVWAEVTVPRCAGAARGADELRLIRFEDRWRIVYIDLFDEQARVAAATR
jgi:hypothetical protein